MGKRIKNNNWQIPLRFFFFFIGVILLLSLSFKIANLIKNSLFDGKNRITLVLASEAKDILVFSLEPSEGEISLLRIPAKTTSQSDKKSGSLLRRTTQDFIGMPVDGWAIGDWKVEGGKWKLERGRIQVLDNLSIKNTLFFLKNGGLQNLDTNLTVIDLLRIWWQGRGVKMDKIEVLDLEEGKSVALDRTIIPLFSDPQVMKSRPTVGILNGTNIIGLGDRVARITGNLGAQILFVKTAPERIKHSSLTVFKAGDYAGQKLSRTLELPLVKSKKEQETNPGVDILILLGEDYLK